MNKFRAPKAFGKGDRLQLEYGQAVARGDYSAAIASALAATRILPKAYAPWSQAAVCALRVERWDDAIRYAKNAIQRGARTAIPYDVMAHAFGANQHWDEAAKWGLKALVLKAAAQPVRASSAPPSPLPSAPSPDTRHRNIIAFSLFGNRAKYCEPAFLNTVEQPELYPNWTCRFYIDDTVPDDIIARLEGNGAEIVRVDDRLRAWPGPMWRFAAIDSPGVHRVLFRDADSVISAREAGAVQQWIESGRSFHHMRDSGSHTALMLAGTWGSVGGALPPMAPLIEEFLSKPVTSLHFADQDFLAQYLWPLCCHDMLSHDSIFGFMEAKAFPDGGPPGRDHVGSCEGAPIFNYPVALPEGTRVTWQLFEVDGVNERPVTAVYATTVRDGAISDNLPVRFAERLPTPSLHFRIERA